MTHPFDKNFIAGRWQAPLSGRWLEVENPATLTTVARAPDSDDADLAAAVAAARAAQSAWADTEPERRADLMETMLAAFRELRSEIIELEVAELGAPVSFAEFSHCDYQYERVAAYIEAARAMTLSEDYPRSTVRREPVGVVACVTPWNYPLGQVVQKAIPAALMGNTVIIKPSQHTPLTAVLLAEAFERASFPPGVINLVNGRGARLGPALALDPGVDMLSFTGSTAVGVALSRQALGTVKRLSLELGGKSPYIWLPSADYGPALNKLVHSIFLNSGQTCTALSRLIVPRRELARITELVTERARSLVVGDPRDPGVDLGPLATATQYDKVRRYLDIGVSEGARLVCGGALPSAGPGYYVAPSVFTEVRNDMRIAREEIFGPVLCLLSYDSVEEAVAIANDSDYGLNAAVYGDREEALHLACRLKSGTVYINDAPRDVTAPFGGYKQSGFGREGGPEGLREFTQLKTICDRSSF